MLDTLTENSGEETVSVPCWFSAMVLLISTCEY